MDSSHFVGPEWCQACKWLYLQGPGSRLRAMRVLTTGSPDRGTCAISTVRILHVLVVSGTRMSSFFCHRGSPAHLVGPPRTPEAPTKNEVRQSPFFPGHRLASEATCQEHCWGQRWPGLCNAVLWEDRPHSTWPLQHCCGEELAACPTTSLKTAELGRKPGDSGVCAVPWPWDGVGDSGWTWRAP